MDASLPLSHGRVDVDGPGLRPEPHRRQDRAHLLYLRKGDFVLAGNFGHAVDDLGRGRTVAADQEPAVNGVGVLGD